MSSTSSSTCEIVDSEMSRLNAQYSFVRLTPKVYERERRWLDKIADDASYAVMRWLGKGYSTEDKATLLQICYLTLKDLFCLHHKGAKGQVSVRFLRNKESKHTSRVYADTEAKRIVALKVRDDQPIAEFHEMAQGAAAQQFGMDENTPVFSVDWVQREDKEATNDYHTDGAFRAFVYVAAGLFGGYSQEDLVALADDETGPFMVPLKEAVYAALMKGWERGLVFFGSSRFKTS